MKVEKLFNAMDAKGAKVREEGEKNSAEDTLLRSFAFFVSFAFQAFEALSAGVAS